MQKEREALQKSYEEFLSLSLLGARVEGAQLPALRALGEAVLAALSGAQVEALYARLEAAPALLYNGAEPVEDPQGLLRARDPAAPMEGLSFSGEHPAFILQALCSDVQRHFGLGGGESVDVDETLLQAFLEEAFARRTGAGKALAPMDLESIISILPTEYVMANTRLSDELSKGEREGGEMDMMVAPRKRGAAKPALTRAILTFGDDKAVITAARQKYTPYDSAVYSGVITLYEAENNVVTPAMVYRAMNGLTDSEYVNPSTLEKVARSIEKNRRSQLSIDFTEEAEQYMRAYGGPAKDFKTTYEGNLLVADKITVKNNGVEQTAYKILRKPILYEYAETVGQVISVPIQLLQTKGGVRSTEDVIVLREYLLRQIENYRRRHRSGSLTLAYRDIYAVCGVSSETHKNLKDKYKKIRSHTEALLGEWQRFGYISAFESRRDGSRAITQLLISI